MYAMISELLVLLVPSHCEVVSRLHQYQKQEDKDLLAMRDINTNFLYTLVCGAYSFQFDLQTKEIYPKLTFQLYTEVYATRTC